MPLNKGSKAKQSKTKQNSASRLQIYFAVSADPRVKLKGREKRDKYQDVARELKEIWKIKVTETPIVIGALRTILKRIGKGT